MTGLEPSCSSIACFVHVQVVFVSSWYACKFLRDVHHVLCLPACSVRASETMLIYNMTSSQSHIVNRV